MGNKIAFILIIPPFFHLNIGMKVLNQLKPTKKPTKTKTNVKVFVTKYNFSKTGGGLDTKYDYNGITFKEFISFANCIYTTIPLHLIF